MPITAASDGRITRERYWQLVADGTIGPEDRVELLDGLIVAISPPAAAHEAALGQLSRLLFVGLAPHLSTRVQLPLEIGACTTTEPDIAVVEGFAETYETANPTSALLVVEVADSTVSQDRLTKGPLYAAADIPEYWIVNLRDGCVEIHRKPVAEERRYSERIIAGSGDRLQSSCLGERTIAVNDILPPAGA
jgi:Uma2 family endonuclease